MGQKLLEAFNTYCKKQGISANGQYGEEIFPVFEAGYKAVQGESEAEKIINFVSTMDDLHFADFFSSDRMMPENFLNLVREEMAAPSTEVK